MKPKYEFTGDSKEVNSRIANGRIVHRIRALRDFADVKTGDLGGWIEKEHNLSHRGKCWVYHDAMVYGNATISGNAIIMHTSQVYGNSKVKGNSWVLYQEEVCGNRVIDGDSVIPCIQIEETK